MTHQTYSDLLKKYNVPGPRYTSYPTVPYWDTPPTAQQWQDSVKTTLKNNLKTNRGAAVYIHIPFCQSLCTYCGCNTRITRNRVIVDPYIDALLNEWSFYSNEEKISLSELHLGGGTPTYLTPVELEKLLLGILKNTHLTDKPEFSIEVDPRVTTEEQIKVLSGFGFKRISLGIQDFDPKVQDIVHRTQSADQVKTLTENARKVGFESVNYDLIYGLPLQTHQSIQMTIETVCQLKPDRIAFYGYAHVPWIKPGQRRFTEADLPSGDEKRALYELGRQLLQKAGYEEIGMDHFALKTDSLWQATTQGTLHRNFMGYTSQQVLPLIGLGVSAIGDSGTVFSQNEKVLETYLARIQKGELPRLRGHVLNEEDLCLRQHILNVMNRFSTSWQSNDLECFDGIVQRLKPLAEDGLVELSENACHVTLLGRAFLRNICMAFDVRLSRQKPEKLIFSKAI